MYPYGAASSGFTFEQAGSVTAVQMPNNECYYVRLKARAANTGKAYVGFSNAVTKADGTADTTSGFELSAKDDTGWIPIRNTNKFWVICDNATDTLIVMGLVV